MTSRLPKSALAAGLLLAAALPAAAAPIPFAATLTIQMGRLPAITETGSGVADSGGAGGHLTIPAGVFSIATSAPLTPPLLVIDGFAAGATGQAFAHLPLAPGTSKALAWNGVTGAMPLEASAYGVTGYSVVPNPSTTIARQAALAIPLSIVGVGGNRKFAALGGVIKGTVHANPYRLGMVTLMGGVLGEVSTLFGTGFDNRTAGGRGTLQLVSPAVVSMNATGSLPVIATLTIAAPEPGTLLLLGGGLAALAALRRGYTRK